ncbi:MAG: hypothetical protein ACK4NY_04545 [Spirosomataceae bacterium]
MQTFLYFFYILCFLFFCYNIHQTIKFIATSLSDYLLKYFIVFVGSVIPTGFFLSEMNWINQPFWWIFVVYVISTIPRVIFYFTKKQGDFNLSASAKNKVEFAKKWFSSLGTFQRIAFAILFITLGFTALINVAFLLFTVPNEWDSMTGHLAKCAYYLQNGNMNRMQGTTWTIDFYPNSLPSLQIFFYHLAGEKGFRIIHFASYWVSILAMYGIAQKLYKDFTIAVLVALLMALLPTAIVQAANTETDLVMTAYLGCLAYFILTINEQSQKALPTGEGWVWLILTGCIALGHKVTFILISPAVFILIVSTILKTILDNKLLIISTLIIGIAIYVLPTGYIGNIKEEGRLGGISGPKEVMMWHGNDQFTGKQITKFGTLNVIRYGYDFFNLDGIRNLPNGEKLNDAMRYLPNKIGKKINIERPEYTVVAPFQLKPVFPFHRERPFWGIISFLMVLPAIGLLFTTPDRVQNPVRGTLIGLLLASIVHFLTLCYTAPYDPIKARYFMNMGVWALPLAGLLFVDNKRTKYLLFCSIFIALAAIGTILYRVNLPILSAEKSIFSMNRMEQLTISRPEIYEAYKKFDELVPQSAIVALGTQQEHEDFEYPLWGEQLTRKLIPIHPFRKAVKPIPTEAEYLFYSKGVIQFKEGDILLNNPTGDADTPVEESAFYLRKLK